VDGDDRAGDVAGEIGAEEEDDVRDVLRIAEPAERGGLARLVDDVRRNSRGSARGADTAGSHGVDVDVARSEFEGGGPGERDQSRVRGAEIREAELAADGVDGRYVDDPAVRLRAEVRGDRADEVE